MTLTSNFIMMADYNQWMNTSTYDAAAKLTKAELAQDRGAFFGSILGTLNHILVADTIWLKRFAQYPFPFKSLAYIQELKMPTSLDENLYPELAELHAARKAMDKIILEFASELTDEMLTSPLTYSNTQGIPFSRNFGALVQHFFNHQTHHRGQVSTLLYQAGIDVGVTDLLAGIPNK